MLSTYLGPNVIIGRLKMYLNFANSKKRRVPMKPRLFVLLLAGFLVAVWGSTALSQTVTTTQLEQLYSNYIDGFIARCESKAEWRNSKLVNIRREAALYCFKAHYLEKYQDQLIKDMIAENIGLREHRIHFYLNQRFFSMLRSATASLHHWRSGSRVMWIWSLIRGNLTPVMASVP